MNCGQSQVKLKELKKCGCNGESDSNGTGVQYEPLTVEWFKQNAGIIALVITVLGLLFRN